jgi:hypothetical protein
LNVISPTPAKKNSNEQPGKKPTVPLAPVPVSGSARFAIRWDRNGLDSRGIEIPEEIREAISAMCRSGTPSLEEKPGSPPTSPRVLAMTERRLKTPR